MMTGVETILLVILGVFLAILLILSIVVVYVLVRIMQNIHHITQKAEATTDNLAETLTALGKRLAPGVISLIVGTIFERVKKRRNQKEEDHE